MLSTDSSVAFSITTHNRRADLARTLKAMQRLQPGPAEILICADGCRDDTVEWVRKHHPEHRLLIHQEGRGSVFSRDQMLRESRSEIVVCFDDDSYPIETDFVPRQQRLMDTHPRLAVVSFPQRSDEYPDSLQQTEFGPSCYVGTYANSGAAYRRSIYLQLPGFPDYFFHAYEEPDYALQAWSSGFEVLNYTALLVRHRYSAAERSEIRTHQRHSRNELCSVWMRCPWPMLIPMTLFRMVRQLGYAHERGWNWVVREPAWWLAGLRRLPLAWKRRLPVSSDAYWKWLKLLRQPPPIEV